MILDAFADEKTANIIVTQPTDGSVDSEGRPVSTPTTIFDGKGWFWQQSPGVFLQSDMFKPKGSFTAILDPREVTTALSPDMQVSVNGREYNITDVYDLAIQGELIYLGLDYVN
jgi:hypothetical protein